MCETGGGERQTKGYFRIGGWKSSDRLTVFPAIVTAYVFLLCFFKWDNIVGRLACSSEEDRPITERPGVVFIPLSPV